MIADSGVSADPRSGVDHDIPPEPRPFADLNPVAEQEAEGQVVGLKRHTAHA